MWDECPWCERTVWFTALDHHVKNCPKNPANSQDCRCDCVSCVTGDHQGCYYYPVPLCCSHPRTEPTP
jgi:hypothetical protein